MLDTKKEIKYYILLSVSTLIFGFIYELFSHSVYSNYMMFAFIIPLILGIIQILFRDILNNYIYESAVITLTIGSIINGILEIYGTTNDLVYIYLVVGIILIIASIIKNKNLN